MGSRDDYLLMPVSRAYIAFTVMVATVLNILPWGRTLGIPDFAALVLVFWNVHQPRKIGIGIGFLIGLIMDVHNSSTLGERALLYTLLCHGAWYLHRRVPWFRIGGQLVHVLPLMLGAQAVMVVARMATGSPAPGWSIFLQWITTTMLWPVADLILLAPQRRAAARDDNRPI